MHREEREAERQEMITVRGMTRNPRSAPQPPPGEEEWWEDPDRINWRAVAPFAGAAAVTIGVGIWLALAAPWSSSQQPQLQGRPTLTPTSPAPTERDALDFLLPSYSPSPGSTPTVSPSPAMSPRQTPAASPAVPDPASATPTASPRPKRTAPDSHRKTNQAPPGDMDEQTGPDPRPASTKKATTKPRPKSGGSSTRRPAPVAAECDRLFPPGDPEFAMRNAYCHQIYD